MPDSSDDSDDDVPLAQRAVAGEAPPPVPKPVVKSEPVKAPAEPPKRKADASPTSPKKQKAPAAKPEVKAEAKPAAKILPPTKPKPEPPKKAAEPPKKAAPPPASNGSEKRKAAESGGGSKQRKIAVSDDDDDDDEEEDDDDEEEEEEEYSEKKKPSKPTPKPAAKIAPPTKPKPAAKSPPAKSAASPAKKNGKESGGSSTPSVLQGNAAASGKNWFEEGGDASGWKRGGEKWQTLHHNGVIFPPLYEAHKVPLTYDDENIVLPVDCEEVATMFAAMKNTDYATKEIFQKNFMKSWRRLLKGHKETEHIKYFNKCNFTRMADHLAEQGDIKKAMTGDQKKAAKAERDRLEEPFAFAVVDGRREKLGNFRVEPPGLFRGRGEHPKMGQLKARIFPEDITINLSEDAEVPQVPDIGDGKKHKWGEVLHKNTVTWLCKWKDSINGEDKCVWLSANSSWKGMSDMAKYEKARKLKDHIAQVRKDYAADMKSSDVARQQKGVTVYLIDRLALRVGGEKDTDEEADTVGCCSLRVEHVKECAAENMLHLNFLGKDSIEYDNTTEVIPEVMQLIKKFQKKKKPTDNLFDTVQPQVLNDYFHTIMDGLSAKVFRTYNASITLCSELAKTDAQVSQAMKEKKGAEAALYEYYNIANKNVAELCNHQKAASPAHDAAMEKMREKVATMELELKAVKKEKNASKTAQLEKRIDKAKEDMEMKDRLKNVSLGTSKINYNDPRITVAWCKRHDVPIHKPFPKTLMSKFSWAMAIEPEFKF